MKDCLKKQATPGEKELITSFASGVPNCYAAYKKNANLDRVYVKLKYKERKKTKLEYKLEKIKQEAGGDTLWKDNHSEEK